MKMLNNGLILSLLVVFEYDLSTLKRTSIKYEDVKRWVDYNSSSSFGIKEEHGATISSDKNYTVKGFEYKDSYGNTVLNNSLSEGVTIPYGSVLVISENGWTTSAGGSGSSAGGATGTAGE